MDRESRVKEWAQEKLELIQLERQDLSRGQAPELRLELALLAAQESLLAELLQFFE